MKWIRSSLNGMRTDAMKSTSSPLSYLVLSIELQYSLNLWNNFMFGPLDSPISVSNTFSTISSIMLCLYAKLNKSLPSFFSRSTHAPAWAHVLLAVVSKYMNLMWSAMLNEIKHCGWFWLPGSFRQLWYLQQFHCSISWYQHGKAINLFLWN